MSFWGLSTSPPSRIDELVVVSEFIKLSCENDKIIVDTALTGEFLRLLDLTKFVDGFESKVVSLGYSLAK